MMVGQFVVWSMHGLDNLQNAETGTISQLAEMFDGEKGLLNRYKCDI